MPGDKPIDRRRFFRQGLRELLKPLANAVDPIERVAKELGRLEDMKPPGSPSNQLSYTPAGQTVSRSLPVSSPEPEEKIHYIRPPGALPEDQFLSTCSRCSVCVNVCPSHCIKLDYSHQKGNGAPYIEPDDAACILCDELACMTTCPSGALVLTQKPEIDIGSAVWHEQLCLRTHGDPCTICVDHCPVGHDALAVLEDKIRVNESACTGCGVCQNNCPTNPKSITVTPKSARENEYFD